MLVLGFPRSGTTFLHNLLLRCGLRILYEPLDPNIIGMINLAKAKDYNKLRSFLPHPYMRPEELVNMLQPYIEDNTLLYAIKRFHPNVGGHRYKLLYDEYALIRYLTILKNFSMKETRLLLYVDRDYVFKNWYIIFIIRNPADVYCECTKYFLGHLNKPHYRILLSIGKKRIKEIFAVINKLDLNLFYKPLCEVLSTMRPDLLKNAWQFTLEETFILLWILANYYAASRLNSENIIIYNKPLTLYERLRVDVKYTPVEYHRFREEILYRFTKVSELYDLEDEYEYLLRLIE